MTDTQQPPKDPWPQEIQDAFFDKISSKNHTNKERLEPKSWSLLHSILDNPNFEYSGKWDKKRFLNFAYQGKMKFELVNNVLYRKEILKKTPKGTQTLPARPTVAQNAVFKIIANCHMQLGHPGRDKTFK